MDNTQFDLKSVVFLGRQCMVLCQNANGPCPLLAIANVLLLQNVIYIHPDRSSIALHELIVIVANTFVEKVLTTRDECESSRGLQQQQLNSVLNILPGLARGLDLNVRFSGVSAFEFTEEISVFDALDIPLLHGWVLDPQDTITSSIIHKNHSFNHLMYKIVEYRTALENISVKNKSACKAADADINNEYKNPPPLNIPIIPVLNETIQIDTNVVHVDTTIVHIKNEECTEDSWENIHQREQKGGDTKMLDDQDGDSPYVFVLPEGGDVEVAAEYSSTDVEVAAEHSVHIAPDKYYEDLEAFLAKGDPININVTKGDPINISVIGAETSVVCPAAPAVPLVPAVNGVNGVPGVPSVPQVAEAKQTEEDKHESLSAEEIDLCREGEIIESFLASTASQLTYIGLAALHQNIRERQFAVFFRNNHFSTIFRMHDRLYLLVTDLGYQNQPSVVWERLDGIDGDTEYVDGSFIKTSNQLDSLSFSSPSLQILPGELPYESAGNGNMTIDHIVQDDSIASNNCSQHYTQNQSIHNNNHNNYNSNQNDKNNTVLHTQGNEGDLDPDLLLALQLQDEENEQARKQNESARMHSIPPDTTPQQDRRTRSRAGSGAKGSSHAHNGTIATSRADGRNGRGDGRGEGGRDGGGEEARRSQPSVSENLGGSCSLC